VKEQLTREAFPFPTIEIDSIGKTSTTIPLMILLSEITSATAYKGVDGCVIPSLCVVDSQTHIILQSAEEIYNEVDRECDERVDSLFHAERFLVFGEKHQIRRCCKINIIDIRPTSEMA
jgi:hypothetical protein